MKQCKIRRADAACNNLSLRADVPELHLKRQRYSQRRDQQRNRNFHRRLDGHPASESSGNNCFINDKWILSDYQDKKPAGHQRQQNRFQTQDKCLPAAQLRFFHYTD